MRTAQKKLSAKTSMEVKNIADKIIDPELRESLKKIAEN
jgi:hypothetical protein